MKKLISRFVEDQSGATAVEYGLIGTLVAVAIIVGATALGTQLNLVLQGLSEEMVVPEEEAS
jgi:pilus assembly protein Flp/PilA